MIESAVDERAKGIYLEGNSNLFFILLHGYTSSPSDFNGFERELHEKFDASVKSVRLLGHGTHISDLDKLKYSDFEAQADEVVKKAIDSGKRVVLVGFSFGSQLAINMGAKYAVDAVICASMPLELKFPYNLKGFHLIGRFKKHWNKKLTFGGIMSNKNTFVYSKIHVNGIPVVLDAKRDTINNIARIKCPVVMIHCEADYISSPKPVLDLLEKIPSKKKKCIVIKKQSGPSDVISWKDHFVFFSSEERRIKDEICNFINEL